MRAFKLFHSREKVAQGFDGVTGDGDAGFETAAVGADIGAAPDEPAALLIDHFVQDPFGDVLDFAFMQADFAEAQDDQRRQRGLQVGIGFVHGLFFWPESMRVMRQ